MTSGNTAFEGRVVLITGGGQGLGKEYAGALARRGARVVVADVGSTAAGPTAQVVANQLRAAGHAAVGIMADVSSEAQARGAVAEAVSRFGRIDIVVNNAGNSIAGTAQEVSTENFLAVLNVHLLGSFYVQSEALRHMRRQGYGRIVNTASALGAFGRANAAPYVTAKAAIIGLTKAAALDNEDMDIKVNALCPIAYTPMAKGFHDRLGKFTPEQLDVSLVTPAMLYLAGQACTLSGEVLSAGIGRIARIFTATTPGLKDDTLTEQAVAERLDRVMSTDDFVILRSSVEQFETVLKPKSAMPEAAA
jgi:NAD(P)-dependent dehydrogenase (short-subunit alcohol dehydrogenase family)